MERTGVPVTLTRGMGQEDMDVIKAVIFDWSGTVVDFGSRTPVAAFADHGAIIRDDGARAPMGLGKRHHIEAPARLPRIATAWRKVHGQDITAADYDQLHGIFERRIAQAALRRCALAPGPARVVDSKRGRGR